MKPPEIIDEALDLERTARENVRLADVPANDNHPNPVEVTPPLVTKQTQEVEFPYGQ